MREFKILEKIMKKSIRDTSSRQEEAHCIKCDELFLFFVG